jgi:hypothetical protein
VGINVEIKKIADDGRLVRYSFLSSTGEQRSLTVDRKTEQVWPDDDLDNIEYHGAVLALVKVWREHGDFPDRARHQA